MRITINTDASYHPKYSEAGFAFWISCDVGRYKMYGPLKDCKSSNEAEIQAIGNALYFLMKSDLINNDISKIYINTDSDAAIHHIGLCPPKMDDASVVRGFIAKICSIQKKKKIDLFSFRSVKAHSGVGSPRKFVNDWCDKMSKKGRKLNEKVSA